jgi:hypothetical protein
MQGSLGPPIVVGQARQLTGFQKLDTTLCVG